MTTLRPIYDCPAHGFHAYIDGSIHHGSANGCEACAMEDARRQRMGHPTSADVAKSQTGVPRTADDTCTRSMRVPAGRALSQYERDRLAGEIRKAASVPYSYDEPGERMHPALLCMVWGGMILAGLCVMGLAVLGAVHVARCA